MKEELKRLVDEHPELANKARAIAECYAAMLSCFQNGGKLMLCGNGGSACDCEHIAGELMKGFLLKRPLLDGEREALARAGDDGMLANVLQRAVPVLVLSGLSGLSTAFLNDVEPQAVFAQQAYAYARPGDVLMGISTSGNSKNVIQAMIAAKARGAKIIALTGEGGGKMAGLCDVLVDVPQKETYRVQELHLPVYHALCAALESELYGKDERA